MIKNIIQALIIAFLLFLIPVIYNIVTGGGLIRLLGGVSQREFQELQQIAIRNGDTLRLLHDSDTRRALHGGSDQPFDVRVHLSRPGFKEQQWVVERVSNP